MRRTKQFVATSGVAAALLIAAPVGAALADDTELSGDTSSVVSDAPVGSGDAVPDSAPVDEPASVPSSESETPAAPTPADSDDSAAPAAPTTAEPDVPAVDLPALDRDEKSSRDDAGIELERDADAAPASPGVDRTAPLRDGSAAILDELRDQVAPLTTRLAPAALDDAEAPSARSGFVGWLADLGGPGVVEFLLLNQSALALALVNRSPRLSGVGLADLRGEMNAPARQPAVATLSLNRAAGLADDADPDNWFLDRGDADYDPDLPFDADAVGVDAEQLGITYGFSKSRDTMTIYNDGAGPISVTYFAKSEEGDVVETFTVLDPGTHLESAEKGLYLVQGRRQDANGVDTAGGERPAFAGKIVFVSDDGEPSVITSGYDDGRPFPLSEYSDPIAPGLVVYSGPPNPVSGVTYLYANAGDVGGGPVGPITVTQPANGTVDWSDEVQAWRYTADPAKSAIGEVRDQVTFTVTDEAGTSKSRTIEVVTPKLDPTYNHAPVVLGVDAEDRPDDQRWQDFQVRAVDGNGDPLEYRVGVPLNAGSGPNYGTVENLGGGRFRYTPTADATLREGAVRDSFRVEVDDGRGGVTNTWVTVDYAWAELDNVAPVIESSEGGVFNAANGAYSYTFTASDADGDDLRWVVSGQPEHGQVSGYTAADGSFVVTYYADLDKAHQGGFTDEITVSAIDQFGGSDSRTVQIDVETQNTDPWMQVSPEKDGFVANEDLVWGVDSGDNDGDPIQVRATAEEGGDVRVVDGKVVYTPKAQVNGGWLDADGVNRGYYVDVVQIEVTDDHGGSTVEERHVAVVDTAWVPWVDPDKAAILVVDLDHHPDFQRFVDGGYFSGTVPLDSTMNDDFVAYTSNMPHVHVFDEYDAMLLTARYCAANDCGTVEEPEEPGDPDEPGNPGNSGGWFPDLGQFGNWLPSWRLPQTAPGDDVVNAQWERDWEKYTMMVGFFPVVGTFVNGVSFGINLGQWINAVGRGDSEDIADETGDLIGDAIGFVPIGGKVLGNVLEPYVARPIGSAVGDLLQGAVGGAVGSAVGGAVRVVGDGIAGFFWGVGNIGR